MTTLFEQAAAAVREVGLDVLTRIDQGKPWEYDTIIATITEPGGCEVLGWAKSNTYDKLAMQVLRLLPAIAKAGVTGC